MTTLTSPSTEQLKQQVDLLLRSPVFATSETLRKLLSFLALHAMEGRAESLKVREIAVTVFGRAEDFDSQSDSVVRVHTGRLRSKLAEYYMEDGADDEVIIAIPKGGYALTCHFRHSVTPRVIEHAGSNEVSESLAIPVSTGIERMPAPYLHRRGVSWQVLVVSILIAVLGTWRAVTYAQNLADRDRVPASLRTFWQDFLNPAENSLVVFSNFRFLNGGATAGLLTYSGPDDPQKPIIDTYTTMGEVMGVYDVSRMLTLMGKQPEAKRSRLLTWDEAKDSNLIFVGGPLAETPLRDVTLLKDFQFKNGNLPDGRNVGVIFNNKPRAGEGTSYFASRSVYDTADVHTSKTDYAVIALRPSFSTRHHTLVLAGISEYGTQGAADFVTSESCVRELLEKLGIKRGQSIPPFEALIRVRIEGGVPVQSDLVLVHFGD